MRLMALYKCLLLPFAYANINFINRVSVCYKDVFNKLTKLTNKLTYRSNCSTPDADVMTTSTGALRETAIMGDSSDDKLDANTTGNSCGANAICAASRHFPSSGIASRRRSLSLSDIARCEFASRLDHGPETDILHSESVSEVGGPIVPKVETYLRLPPTSPFGHDIKLTDKLSATNADNNELSVRSSDQTDEPEVNSTSSTTTTTMSLKCRSSSVDIINRVGVNNEIVIPASSLHRYTSDRRQRRLRAPETEIRRRRTSPIDRKAAVATAAREARRAVALANWAKLRQHFQQHRLPVDDPRFQAAALRLFGDEVRRSRSAERRGSRRVRRISSSRDRRCCLSAEAGPTRGASRPAASAAESPEDPPFRSVPHLKPRPSGLDAAELGELSTRADSVSITADLASGCALPYDYEPLSFSDVGAGAFSYTDDPFDYEETDDRDGGKVTVPITICLIIIAGYIFAGAVLFTLWEDWDYLTGSYFCFITLSTIGFGDIVPGTDMDKWASSEKLVLCALWLAFGLSLLAMCFNLMQEEVREKCKWIGLRLGLLRDDEQQ